MSKPDKKLININRNEFIDRSAKEPIKFSHLTIQLETIDSILLLLDSDEETVLVNVLRHIMQQAFKNKSIISLLQEKTLLQLLLQKRFFRNSLNIFVKRLTLGLASFIMENSNCLLEFQISNLQEIVCLSLELYKQEDDDFCCEYLSVIINECLAEPQCCDLVLEDSSFVLKYFSTIASTTDPDILLYSLEVLLKLLTIPDCELVTQAAFPFNRLLCELSCEFFEIRRAALKVLHFLLLDSKEDYAFYQNNLASSLLKQLTNIFCKSPLNEELILLVAVLTAALGHEPMISLFFELNLFDEYLERLNDGSLDKDSACKALWVLAESAKCKKFLGRLVSGNIPEKMLDCLLTGDIEASFPILLGLNRLMASSGASKIIIDSYARGLLQTILKILSLKEIPMKTREQSAHLLEKLLSYSFHKTAELILDSNFPTLLADIFSQDPDRRSTDLILSLLYIIEVLSANSDFRAEICKSTPLLTNMSLLLKNSFSNAVLATRLFRCLGCLVVEEQVHDVLLETFMCSSIKRGLQSSSNQVKSAVTNFIMQTTRFRKFMDTYSGTSILEVLLLRQKHAFCVPTWQPAIESILAKNLTMKFCIRNSLGFVDVTVGHDFKEEVSPLHPVIVVNFNRPKNPEHLIVKVPKGCFQGTERSHEASASEWCYCRSPGDEFLPQYLQEVKEMLAAQNLITTPLTVHQNIDFDNLAKRAKVVAQVVEQALSKDLKLLDLNALEECSSLAVDNHLKEMCFELHCSFIPLGRIRTGCKFERAILFKALADQIGLPCTLQRSVDGRVLFNELALPLAVDDDSNCNRTTLSFIPWRMLRPTHMVDLMYDVGELYPLQSRQALQYLRFF